MRPVAMPGMFDPRFERSLGQLLGPAFSEPRLLRIARMYERATEWHTRRPG